ncbi:MAG: hypothetical protein ABGY42_14620 [bacterium]
MIRIAWFCATLCCLIATSCGSSNWPESMENSNPSLDSTGGATPLPASTPTDSATPPPATPGFTPVPDLVCGTEPECECLVNECLPLPLPVSIACELAVDQAPECTERLLAALAVEGCGPNCGGLTIPGLDILCEAPECETLRDILFGSILPDVCRLGCDCQPDCSDRACGDDGCGGSCGTCDPGEVCDDGNCEAVRPPCEIDGGGCACALSTCLPVVASLLNLNALCDASLLPDSCTTVLNEAFGAEGCGPVCKGLTVPGLETLCEMPECSDFLDLAALTGAPKICQCFCEPQCEDKVCGADGCGGLCGACPEGESCGFGECLTVNGECTDSEFTCFCATQECESKRPIGQRFSLCSRLTYWSPECYQAVMREYAEKGCQTSSEETDILGQATICNDEACTEFRTQVLTQAGIDLCTPPPAD